MDVNINSYSVLGIVHIKLENLFLLPGDMSFIPILLFI